MATEDAFGLILPHFLTIVSWQLPFYLPSIVSHCGLWGEKGILLNEKHYVIIFFNRPMLNNVASEDPGKIKC